MIYRIAFKDAEGYTWGQQTPTDDLGRAMADAELLAIQYDRPVVVQVWESGPYPSGRWYDYAEKGSEE